MRHKHKFGAIRCTSDDIKFPSKLERNYYNKLKLLQNSGEILFFLLQPRFETGGGTKYTADFLEFWADGSVRVTDCKGVLTKEFVRNKKIVESLYPVEIEVVTKV